MRLSIALLILCFFVIGCNDQEESSGIISRIESRGIIPMIGAFRSNVEFLYDGQGRINEIVSDGYLEIDGIENFNVTTIIYDGSTVFIDYEDTNRFTDSRNSLVFEGELLKQYVIKNLELGVLRSDTINFYYDNEQLSQLEFNSLIYEVDMDDSGNVTAISGNDFDLTFEHDSKPNPLQSVPWGRFGYVTQLGSSLYFLNIVEYFSKNNIIATRHLGDIVTSKKYKYTSNGFPSRLTERENVTRFFYKD